MNAIAQSLGAVSEQWLDPKKNLREETIQALQVSTGFSRRQLELSLTNAFSELTAEKIQAFISSEHLSPSTRPLNVLHVLPSNAFTSWLPGAVIALLLEHHSRLKPSLREPVFARAWIKSLMAVDASLEKKVEIVSWNDRLLGESNAVVAYGSDETLMKLRRAAPQGIRFVGYGHKLSVGVVFKDALDVQSLDAILEQVHRDAEPFRLQGCPSPQILYVEEPIMSAWKRLSTSLDVAPKIKPFTQWKDALEEISKFIPYLSCVGYAGAPERAGFLEGELRDCGVSRICPLGEMQRPPLSWRNGEMFLPDLLN